MNVLFEFTVHQHFFRNIWCPHWKSHPTFAKKSIKTAGPWTREVFNGLFSKWSFSTTYNPGRNGPWRLWPVDIKDERYIFEHYFIYLAHHSTKFTVWVIVTSLCLSSDVFWDLPCNSRVMPHIFTETNLFLSTFCRPELIFQ